MMMLPAKSVAFTDSVAVWLVPLTVAPRVAGATKSAISFTTPSNVKLSELACPALIIFETVVPDNRWALENEPPAGMASHAVTWKSTVPVGAAIKTVHVRDPSEFTTHRELLAETFTALFGVVMAGNVAG